MGSGNNSVYSLLEELQHEPYVFAMIEKGRITYGTTPEITLTSWEDVQQWQADTSNGSTSTQHAVGYIGYEQGYSFIQPAKNSALHNHTEKTDALTMPPVYFGVFSTLHEAAITEESANDDSLMEHLALQAIMDQTKYTEAFTTILEHIKQGDIYQANLTYRFEGPLAHHLGAQGGWELLSYLYGQQPTNHSVYIRTPEFSILSVSPEQFLHITPTTVTTSPMKGTASRSVAQETDARLRDELIASKKEQAELDMIIDIHRNDLAKIAVPGTVTVQERRRITKLPTVWQADAVITAERDAKFSVLDIIEANFPAGSITGAPKIRAMEILHEIEQYPRHVYTGAIGVIRSDNTADLNIAIRTAIIQNNHLYYNVGGGIVFDSTAEQEYQETIDKAKILQ